MQPQKRSIVPAEPVAHDSKTEIPTEGFEKKGRCVFRSMGEDLREEWGKLYKEWLPAIITK